MRCSETCRAVLKQYTFSTVLVSAASAPRTRHDNRMLSRRQDVCDVHQINSFLSFMKAFILLLTTDY